MRTSNLKALCRSVSGLALLAVAGQAFAEAGYDKRLAEAAASIVAERMGPLRGSLDIGARTFLQSENVGGDVTGRDREATPREPKPGEWHRGLAQAIEHRPTVSPEL